MSEADNRPLTLMARPMWLQLAAVILSLSIFVAIYLQYFTRHETGPGIGYSPLAIGAGSYFVLMCALNYLGYSSSPTPFRLAKAIGVALIEGIVFVFLVMFLILNTLGS